MLDETKRTVGSGADRERGDPGAAPTGAAPTGAAPTGAAPPGAGPVVEDNGPWWLVFILIFAFLFASATAFLVHSLIVTFD